MSYSKNPKKAGQKKKDDRLNLESHQDTGTENHEEDKRALIPPKDILSRLYHLPGEKILDQILSRENSQQIVQDLPSEDFFWLVKKVGEQDCIPLLELATVEQWQYLLDLEIWEKDRLDLEQTSAWIERFQEAEPGKLIRWLFGEGHFLAQYEFHQNLEVVILDRRDDFRDLQEGFFTLEGVFHVRVTDEKRREALENILRGMAAADFARYQAFLVALGGALPTEMEEEMYRLRTVRLAEHGFLPLEEALSVYAPLSPEALGKKSPEALPDVSSDEEAMAIVPVSPLYHAESQNMLTEAPSRINDPIFLDRIRLEFAGLCNQILSAEGVPIRDLDVLTGTCRKAARLINLALEKLGGKDIFKAEQLMRTHSLVSLFRAGYGLGLKLKWEAERWVKQSWFSGQDLNTGFWGESWGGMLAGLLQKRPRFYAAFQEGEEYRDFEWLSDLGECLGALRRLMVVDSLLERLAARYPIDEDRIRSPELTFRPLLLNFWSRLRLQVEPCFSGINLGQAKNLFRHIRAGDAGAPYRMADFQETFVDDFMAYAAPADTEAAAILRDTLSLIWQEFREEYEWVSIEDLDERYSGYITILSV